VKENIFEITWTNESGRKKYKNTKTFFIDFLHEYESELKDIIKKDRAYRGLLKTVMEGG
jgi:hypothetical protein